MSKKEDKLFSKLKKLDDELYSNKNISKEEILIHKMSKSLKRYYNSISKDRQVAFIKYILDTEAKAELDILGFNRSDELEDASDHIKPKKCKNLAEVIAERANEKKCQRKVKKKKKNRDLIERNDGLLMLINREAYDNTLLNKKNYRKQLAKIASDTRSNIENEIELDCTLKGFEKQLTKNPSVNQAISDSFFNKYGISI